MAFNNYLEDENDKPYFTTNSLAYYYDKMEGFAKAVEGSAKALNLTKEEVEKRLTLYIEQNKNELDQRLDQWDEKIETLDSSVETLLTEWVDDGTLTHVIDSTLIDQKVAPLAVQLAEIPDIHVSSGNYPNDAIGKNGDLFFIAMTPKTYYFLGKEGVKWVSGASTGAGEVTKQSDHLRIEARYEGTIALQTAVTDIAVDLTDVSTLFIEWGNTGVDGTDLSAVQTKFAVSTDKTGSQTVYNVRVDPTTPNAGAGTYAKQVTQANVSALTGVYYLRVHARTIGLTPTISRVNVYRVWGE